MKKKYIVNLSAQERQDLTDLVRKGKAAAYRRTHAQIMLFADEGDQGPGYKDSEVAERAGVHHTTVSRLRERCVEQGLEAALERQANKRNKPFKLDGKGEAQWIALMCSEPPAGYAKWSLHLAANQWVSMGVVESISHETVRQVLKKRF